MHVLLLVDARVQTRSIYSDTKWAQALRVNADIFKACTYVSVFVICTCRYAPKTGMCAPAWKYSALRLLHVPEDMTGTEWRTVRCVEMPQLIISIISSSGPRSANVWHAFASVDMSQSWLNEWWNQARWEKNKTAFWEKKEREKEEEMEEGKKKHHECQA